jgi:mono/diheme cytochrome c family protein
MKSRIELIVRGVLAAVLLAPAAAPAQDGKAEFATHCSACHGLDGKGAQQAFPPLAGSPWVAGDPQRSIKAVLHGLHGPIEVNGKNYDLEMMPLGTTLNDAQIAAILTYVRSSWGHKFPAVTQDEVKLVRSANSKRTTAWTAPELLKAHPLESANPPIKNLISHVYLGDWKSMPDISKLEPNSAEEEHDGLISETQAERDQKYVIVWKGEIEAPADAEYTFRLDADDSAAVFVNDQPVIEVKNGSPNGSKAKNGKIQLTKGLHPIRIEYFQGAGGRGIFLAMSGKGITGNLLLSKPKAAPGAKIPVVADPGEAVIYRNFIDGASPRAIGVGYDGGINLAFDAQALGLTMVWTGAFIDAGRHWNGRGQGNQPPAGENLATLGKGRFFALLADPNEKWPAAAQDALPFRFRGYRMDKAQQPTFLYELGTTKVTDQPLPDFSNNKRALRRTLVLESASALGQPLWLRLAQGKGVAAAGTNAFTLGNGATLTLGGKSPGTPVLRGTGEATELLIPITVAKGTTRLELVYSW